MGAAEEKKGQVGLCQSGQDEACGAKSLKSKGRFKEQYWQICERREFRKTLAKSLRVWIQVLLWHPIRSGRRSCDSLHPNRFQGWRDSASVIHSPIQLFRHVLWRHRLSTLWSR